jgi:HK97 family phage prohead protease
MFNLLDRGGDIVLPGAFKASLADWRKRKAQPPMLWQHDPYTPVGVWTELAEDEKGLKVTGELILDVPQAAAARALCLAGAVKGLSIGYRTIDYEIDRKTGVRKLKKLELWEVSLVTFPMLPEAQISGRRRATSTHASWSARSAPN